MTDIAAPVITALGIVIVGLLSLYGVVRTAQVARSNNERTSLLDTFQAQLTARDGQILAWREDATRLRQRLDESDARHQKMTTRLDELERGLAQERRERSMIENKLEAVVRWARSILPVLVTNGLAYPPPPPDVTQTDPGSRRAYRDG